MSEYSSTKAKLDRKLLLLNEIFIRKEVIFGNFNTVVDGRKKKLDSWAEIKTVMSANGCEKTVSELRDVMWQNIRKTTMKKIDNSRQTGGEGGQECKLTEVDNLVLLIVGKESLAVQDLNVKESCVKEPTSTPTVKDNGSTYFDLGCQSSALSLLREKPSTPSASCSTPNIKQTAKNCSFFSVKRDDLLEENL